MKHNDYWSNFTRTGNIDDYLNYIACTKEEITDECGTMQAGEEEGGFCAGINCCDRNGSISHAGWRL